MWSLKGQQPKIYTHGGRKRQPLIGAVDPIRGNLHVALTDGLKTEQFQHFLEGLLQGIHILKDLSSFWITLGFIMPSS